MEQTALNFNTRNVAYRSIKGELGARQAAVLEVIRANPAGISSAEIARTLKLGINQITGRVFELRAVGKVIPGEDRADKWTGRTVHTWKAIQ